MVNGGEAVRSALAVVSPPNDARLRNLAISPGTLNEPFASGTVRYTASVRNDLSRLTVTPMTNNPNATVAFLDGRDNTLTDADTSSATTFEVDLAVGATVVKVRVTAQDRTTTQTTVTVTRAPPPSSDATLSGLAISPGTLNEPFASETVRYTASVRNDLSRLTVTPMTNNPNATVAFLDGRDNTLADADTSSAPTFEVDLAVGATVVKVQVTAQDRTTTQTYTVTVTRAPPPSSDATLSGLAISPGTLNEPFASEIVRYTASVRNDLSRLTVTPVTNNPNATVAFLDGRDNTLADADTSSAPTFEVDLAVGATVVKVQVTAQDRTTTQTYTVTVTRAPPPSSDATLSGLAISPGTLNEPFASETVRYTASVRNDLSRLTVTPVTNNPNATVAFLDGRDNTLADADTSSAPTFEVDLAVGATVVKVQVTAQDRTTTQTYTVTVTRAPPPSSDATLSGLAISPGTLNEPFASETVRYTASVRNDLSRLTVTPVTNNPNATVAFLDGRDNTLADADTSSAPTF